MAIGLNNLSNRRLICPACKILLWKDPQSIPETCAGCDRIILARSSFRLWLFPCTAVGMALAVFIMIAWIGPLIFTPRTRCDQDYGKKVPPPICADQVPVFRAVSGVLAIIFPFLLAITVKRKRTVTEISDQIENEFNMNWTPSSKIP